VSIKRSKPNAKPAPKSKKPRKPKPFEDAPFGVDPLDDGDIATPKPQLDEQEIIERNERR
jgi:hypothetical protein